MTIEATITDGQIVASITGGINIDVDDEALAQALAKHMNMSTPHLVTAAEQLTASELNRRAVASGTTANYTINLPSVNAANEGDGVLVEIARSTTKLITVAAAAASGLFIEGQASVNLAAGEKVLFIYDGTEWVMHNWRRVPFVAEMVNGASITLTADTFVFLPLAVGAQLMNNDLSGLWFSTDRFIAPRESVYTFKLEAWIRITGDPCQYDVGFYENTPPAAPGTPASSRFVRLNAVDYTFQSAVGSISLRVAKGNYVVPMIAIRSPATAGDVVEAATLVTRMTVIETITT